MSKWFWIALWAALPLWAGEHEAPPAIALYVDFQHAPSTAVRDAIQLEVDVIMAPMGSELEWRELKAVGGGEVSLQLAVVKFLGRCEATGVSVSHAIKEGALGWTHVSDGTILPFSDIDCDGIRQFLQMGLHNVDCKDRERAYGRAVGRVLAHELYHIFAHTEHHGSNGVGKAMYSVRDLLAPDFRFEERESELLRSSRPREALETVDGSR